VRSTSAITGIVSRIRTGAGGEILEFDITATIWNDTGTEDGTWAAGSNQHGETLTATAGENDYRGTLLKTKMTADFALSDPGNTPGLFASPYRESAPFIVATNEDQLAWYCWTPTPQEENPGSYFVPTWDFGDIQLGSSSTRVMGFTVQPPGLLPGTTRYTAILDSYEGGQDILLNRTTSLKISTWLDDPAVDPGTAYPYDQESGGLRSSDVSVFHNIEDPGDGDDSKWEQLPDLDITGMDVNATEPYVLADDFLCTKTNGITNIVIWGSWRFDEFPGDPIMVDFTLSFHADIPTNAAILYSRPENPALWWQHFPPGTFMVELEAEGLQEGWYDPEIGEYIWPGDSMCLKYTFPVTNNVFIQRGAATGTVYWLDVQARVVGGTGLELFGWKTTTNNWNDDAVWAAGPEPDPGMWHELIYPPQHEWASNSVDLAFRLDAGPVLDFGDAPTNYPTTLAKNGARHVIGGPWLGSDPGTMQNNAPDSELDGQPHPSALGDDGDGNDDERGVWIATGSELVRGVQTNYNVIVNGGTGVFQMWIDWNTNGTFEGSELVTNVTLAAGSYNLPIMAPTNAAVGRTFARCRISSAGGLTPVGLAPDGEVEDHALDVGDGYADWGNLQWPPATTTYPGTATSNIYGRVYVKGVTDGAGQGPGVTAQAGVGPNGINPDGSSLWNWFGASYNTDYGTNDEYMTTLTVGTTGRFDYAYRYTQNGLEWTYGDKDGSGNGYAVAQAGDLVVNELPPFDITNIAVVVTADTATVRWEAEDRVVYQMQYVTNLMTTNIFPWTNIGAQVIGPTNVQSDTNANMDFRAYRVIAPYAAP